MSVMADDNRKSVDEANRRYAEMLAKNREAKEQARRAQLGDKRAAGPILDEQLNTVIDAPSAEPIGSEQKVAEQVATHLAEAQVGLAARCTVCGKPVIGRDVPRDRDGRPRHHRCPQ